MGRAQRTSCQEPVLAKDCDSIRDEHANYAHVSIKLTKGKLEVIL